MLKALGEDGARSPLAAAAAVSAPLQLGAATVHLSGAGRMYQDLLLRYVKVQLARKRLDAAPGLDLAAALAARDFHEFGNAWIAPQCGYADSHAYCREESSGRFVDRIRRPTLVLQALDDPFLGAGALPSHRPAPLVRIEVAACGGHVGFVDRGGGGLPRSWLESRTVAHLDRAFGRGPRARRPAAPRNRWSPAANGAAASSP